MLESFISFHLLSLGLLLLNWATTTDGGSSDFTSHGRSTANNTSVYGTGNAEGHAHVHLGERVRLVRTCIFKISQRTGIDHVTNLESLDSLILGNASTASVAHQKLSDTSSIASVTSVISSLYGHVYSVYFKNVVSGFEFLVVVEGDNMRELSSYERRRDHSSLSLSLRIRSTFTS